MIASGFAVGLDQLPNWQFDPNKPFRCCLICGAITQNANDRTINSNSDLGTVVVAKDRRDEWARKHARQHSPTEHQVLALSGLSMMPAAAHKLAAYGIIPLADLAQDANIQHALLESNPVPLNDAEG